MPEESREVRETRPVWEAEVPWVVAYLREVALASMISEVFTS